MPGIAALISAISADVQAKYGALTDGAIVIGQGHVDENSSPPRVIFIPKGPVKFEAPSTPNRSAQGGTGNLIQPGAGLKSITVTQFGGGYSNSPTVTIAAPQLAGVTATAVATVTSNGAISQILLTNAGSGYTAAPTVTISDSTGTQATAVANLDMSAERLAQRRQRNLFNEVTNFEVHCWAVATPTPDPNTGGDFDACQALYQQVIASSWLLAPGNFRLGSGQWLDSSASVGQRDKFGAYFVFNCSFTTPVLDLPLTAAPVGTVMAGQTFILPFSGGSREAGPAT